MVTSRAAFLLSATLAVAGAHGARAGEIGNADATPSVAALSSTAAACEAETWPNISPACATGRKATAPRQVRVISIDAGSPRTVPLPDTVRAEYASKLATEVAAKPAAATPVPGEITPNQDLASTAVDESAAGPAEAKDVAKTVEDSKATRRAASAARKQRLGAERARRKASDGYALNAPSDQPTVYQDAFGRQFVVGRATRDLQGASTWRNAGNETRGWNPFD